jgi:Chaperone of endosialidase
MPRLRHPTFQEFSLNKNDNQNMTTLYTRKSIHRSSLRHGLLLILLVLVCFALAPAPQAFAVSPAPDGGYPGNNTAEGASALFSLISGVSNTALGCQALYRNTTGSFNTATGFRTLYSNTSGVQNTATGGNALSNNTTGSYNTADGVNALFANTIGSKNTASGLRALFGNSTGSENTAVGVSALASNENGNQNTAVGFKALLNNRGGNHNIALGHEAGSLVGGMFNPRDNNIELGNAGDFFDNNTIRIGDVQTATFIAGISGAPVVGDTVVVDANGQLGTATSSARFKKEIKPMDKASEAILALKPVSFQYKSDPNGTRQFGLIAEDVAKVNPDLVTRDRNGEIYSVRYEAVNAMLLNEFLKQHKAFLEERRKVGEQEAAITQLQSTVAQQQKDFPASVEQLTTRLDEQAAQIQKVSEQVKVTRFATGRIRDGGQVPQVVSNNQ